MKSDYKFSNLLGTVYRQGNLVFTPDGTGLLSPVGNRVSFFDLVKNTSFTFPYEHRRNITCIALNQQGSLLLTVSDDGKAILVNFKRRTVIHHFNFNDVVSDIQFSPDSQYFAINIGSRLEVWAIPAGDTNSSRSFAPFVRHKRYEGHFAEITSITWSDDSRFFLTTSKDLTCRVWSLMEKDKGASATLGGHRDTITNAFFSQDQETIYTVSKDGACFEWRYEDGDDDSDEGDDSDVMRPESKPESTEGAVSRPESSSSGASPGWTITDRHYFNQQSVLKCSAFHAASNILVVGFANGSFAMYELPSMTQIQTMSVSQHGIDYVTINATGEWMALGASKLGQLLVWEWQSESYILKQQGHFDSMNSLVYSPDGSKVVTASEDGKIKLWDTSSGFCLVTFTEHSAAVTALEFSRKGNVLFSASLDGSVRAWDLIRYRNFRTFAAPDRVQFSSLAVDPSGEVVCAGSLDNFDIYVWSVQTSQLLDTLAGHEGPVSCLSFGAEIANASILASASWDHTVRVWNIFARTQTVEPFQLTSDVLQVVMRPDSKQLSVSTLNGEITIWDIEEGKQVGGIDGAKDISGGRHSSDRFSAKNSARSKYFTCMTYSADGKCLIAGGNSRFICLYDVASAVLLKRFEISRNMSLEGTLDYLNSKNMTEAGALNLINDPDASDWEDRVDDTLPGVVRGDKSKRRTRPEIRTTAIKFSPTGRQFAAASTEGLLMYSIDDELMFDPFDLDVDVTPQTTLQALSNKEYLIALVMAHRLNVPRLIQRVYESIPVDTIERVSRGLPVVYLDRFLRFLASASESTPHAEFHLRWIKAVITAHGRHMAQRKHEYAQVLRAVQKFVTRVNKEVARLAGVNGYSAEYLLGQPGNQSHVMDSGHVTSPSEVLVPIEQDNDDDEESSDDSDDDSGWFGPESKNDAFAQMDVDSDSDDE